MKTLTFNNCYIQDYERLSNSYYGNPRYEVTFKNNDGLLIAKTATNASLGYALTNYIGKKINITYHCTSTGNKIINNIEEC